MTRNDPILCSFLEQQAHEAQAMAALNPGLMRVEFIAPNGFLLHLSCKGLIKPPGGEIREARVFVVGLRFPSNYLREAPNPVSIAGVLGPHFPFHPNVHAASGQICLGHLRAACPVTDIVIQVVEILTWVNFATHDVLSPEAAQWARNNLDRFPLERHAIHLPPTFAES